MTWLRNTTVLVCTWLPLATAGAADLKIAVLPTQIDECIRL